ncbi:hypothetical protein FRAAL1315 [Frankia alni ACN14a]|uniref:Uncharacterized protein n=1 Tax=Frankia alni (strain DSM 45986 / CECT 9034 / ACN14a) TaxID=326424 RepID=Q0RAM6_FRAAA|nr:hypothetical protein FRAAL1315 [Frankia alni ACN14a]
MADRTRKGPPRQALVAYRGRSAGWGRLHRSTQQAIVASRMSGLGTAARLPPPGRFGGEILRAFPGRSAHCRPAGCTRAAIVVPRSVAALLMRRVTKWVVKVGPCADRDLPVSYPAHTPVGGCANVVASAPMVGA